MAAILHGYAGGLIFLSKKNFCYFSKRKWKWKCFHTFNHFYSEKSRKGHKSTTMTPNLPE